MRDPKRIRKILSKLEELWNKYPDMRFGQLLINFVYLHEKAIWFEEDDKLLEKIEEMI